MSDGTTDPAAPMHPADDVREYLAGRDAPCPRCGYNLRGLSGPACPECEWAIDPEVLRERERFRQWRESRLPGDRLTTAGLIGALMGLAWPLAIGITLIAGWAEPGTAGSGGMAGLAGRILLPAAAIGHIVLAVAFLRWTTGVSKLPRSKRLALALAAWLLGPTLVLTTLAIAAAQLALTGGQP